MGWRLSQDDWLKEGTFVLGYEETPQRISVDMSGRRRGRRLSDADRFRNAVLRDGSLEEILAALGEVCGGGALVLTSPAWPHGAADTALDKLEVDDRLVEELAAEMLSAFDTGDGRGGAGNRAERAADLLVQIDHPAAEMALLAALSQPLEFVMERLGRREPLTGDMLRAQLMFLDGPRQVEGSGLGWIVQRNLQEPRMQTLVRILAFDGDPSARRAMEILGLE